jgi:hypothetical protein
MAQNKNAPPKKQVAGTEPTKLTIAAPEKINLLALGNELASGAPQDSTLKVIKLDENEAAIIPFTQDGERVLLHYLEDAEYRGYLRHNENDCILCRIGRKLQEQILLPFFLPVSREIAILAASTTMRPKSLLPQLQNLLRSDKRMVLFIHRDRDLYTISSRELPPDVSDGADIIKDFIEAYRENRISLADVYPLLTNEQLANLPGIAAILKLKGFDR